MRKAIRGFDVLEEEFAWAVLLLQEFTDSEHPTDISGHLVICSPSIGGQWRRPAIIVHRDYKSRLLGDPLFTPCGVAACFWMPSVGKLWLISIHMDASRSKQKYRDCTDQLRFLLDASPLGTIPYISIDANDPISHNNHTPSYAVGPFTSGTAGFKGTMLRALMCEYGLTAANTWHESPLGSATCFDDGRFEPRPVDFILHVSDLATELGLQSEGNSIIQV